MLLQLPFPEAPSLAACQVAGGPPRVTMGARVGACGPLDGSKGSEDTDLGFFLLRCGCGGDRRDAPTPAVYRIHTILPQYLPNL